MQILTIHTLVLLKKFKRPDMALNLIILLLAVACLNSAVAAPKKASSGDTIHFTEAELEASRQVQDVLQKIFDKFPDTRSPQATVSPKNTWCKFTARCSIDPSKYKNQPNIAKWD